jgi:hypothetical protein
LYPSSADGIQFTSAPYSNCLSTRVCMWKSTRNHRVPCANSDFVVVGTVVSFTILCSRHGCGNHCVVLGTHFQVRAPPRNPIRGQMVDATGLRVKPIDPDAWQTNRPASAHRRRPPTLFALPHAYTEMHRERRARPVRRLRLLRAAATAVLAQAALFLIRLSAAWPQRQSSSGLPQVKPRCDLHGDLMIRFGQPGITSSEIESLGLCYRFCCPRE